MGLSSQHGTPSHCVNTYTHALGTHIPDIPSPSPQHPPLPPTITPTGWTKFLEDKYSSLPSTEREALLERMSIIQENPWVKDEM